MKRKEGKPTSACCGAKLRKTPDGEFTNFNCLECGQHVDEAGKPYRYLPTDPTRSLGVSQTDA
jgi:predicted RNA-binding Zn-ribbon protein involved in translation (DUF1610 family)